MSESPYGFQSRGYGSHQAMTEFVRPRTRVLDVGCSSGYLMAHLRDSKNCECVGIEPDPSSLAIARALGFPVLETDALTGISDLTGGEQFDHVIFGDVLEHLVDPLSVLTAIRPLLKTDGSVLVSLPNVVSIHARIRIALGEWRYEDSGIFDRTHLRFFSVASGRELVKLGGFRITSELFVGPLSFLGGRRLVPIVRLRPSLLANQMIFAAVPVNSGE